MTASTGAAGQGKINQRPFFRADHIGSLKRPSGLLQARREHAAGSLDSKSLHALEGEFIRTAVLRQEMAGLGVVTDGDYRREAFHIDFLNAFGGIKWDPMRFSHAFVAGDSQGESPAVFRTFGKINHERPITVDDFKFLAGVTKVLPKVTMPSPSFAHYRGGRAAVDANVYPEMQMFFADLGKAYAEEIGALGQAGCRYVQLDEVHFTFFCDPKMVAALKARGDDPDDLTDVYARLINASIAERPENMSIGVHLCRGNRRSSWVAEGGYDPVAERLFNTIDADIFLLEYDSVRAGGFEPLRFVPKDKRVVLGLVTSKTPELESVDMLMHRIDEAARYIPLDQLAISPQCGFASSTEGNLLDEDAQWRKMELTCEVARRVWGSV